MPNLRTTLKILFAAMSMIMFYLAIATSFKSNLFEVGPMLMKEPWFTTTLIDFYFNIAIISVWVLYKEESRIRALAWIVSFVVLGSITTSLYVLIQFLKLKDNDPLSRVLLKEG